MLCSVGRHALALWCATLAQGLRSSPHAELNESASSVVTASRGLPSQEAFARRWKWYNGQVDIERLEQELEIHSQLDRIIKIVLGVFSIAGPEERPFRDMVRNTWMQYPGVCRLEPYATNWSPQCAVYTTFVLGNNPFDSAGEDDLTILPIKENMNQGKSRIWFWHASNTWVWATHIAKMDLDAFPKFSPILAALRSHDPPCKNMYGGTMIAACGSYPYYPPCGCGAPVHADFLKYNVTDDRECFSYMQGGFYFITRELAAAASKPGEWWDTDTRANCYPEDVTAGHALTRYGKDNNVCVQALSFGQEEAAWHTPGSIRPWTGCHG